MTGFPCGPESVALLTALHTGDDDITVDLISDLSDSTLAISAIAFGMALLGAWGELAEALGGDPNDFITNALARLGADFVT